MSLPVEQNAFDNLDAVIYVDALIHCNELRTQITGFVSGTAEGQSRVRMLCGELEVRPMKISTDTDERTFRMDFCISGSALRFAPTPRIGQNAVTLLFRY